MMKEYIAVILAAGGGSRTGLPMPKQFYKIADKTVLEHVADLFQSNDLITRMVIVANPDYIEQTMQIVNSNSWDKLDKVICGGKERYDSSLAAIKEYAHLKDCYLLFHDAARPMVTNEIVNLAIEALSGNDAVGVAIPTVDTILYVEGGVIKSVPERSSLMRAQTPQCFKLSVIEEAYNRALKDKNFKATDDCGVVLNYMPEVPIKIVQGSEENMKLTYYDDIYFIERILERRYDKR